MDMYDLIVVGGGASGMMVAGAVASCGLKVALYEKNEKLGTKLGITGKGRCNITNNCDVNQLIEHMRKNSKFMFSAFSKFDSQDTMNFFENLGVSLKIERGNRVFPESDRAFDVVKALQEYCINAGVLVKNQRVIKILTQKSKAVGIKNRSEAQKAKNIIIATGGVSYPSTGSAGDGYIFAQQTGHKTTKLKPALVPIILKEKWLNVAEGLSLKNVKLTLFKDNKQIFNEIGELVVTKNGLSGPLILKASCYIEDQNNGLYELSIDLKPGLDYKMLDQRLLREFGQNSNKEISTVLKRVLPKSLIEPICTRAGIDRVSHIYEFKKQQRNKLVSLIKNMKFTVEALAPISQAIVTSGGVDVKEINPLNFESKRINGLFFIGEVIDVYGVTGGFNLQICWSSAMAVAKYILARNNIKS